MKANYLNIISNQVPLFKLFFVSKDDRGLGSQRPPKDCASTGGSAHARARHVLRYTEDRENSCPKGMPREWFYQI